MLHPNFPPSFHYDTSRRAQIMKLIVQYSPPCYWFVHLRYIFLQHSVPTSLTHVVFTRFTLSDQVTKLTSVSFVCFVLLCKVYYLCWQCGSWIQRPVAVHTGFVLLPTILTQLLNTPFLLTWSSIISLTVTAMGISHQISVSNCNLFSFATVPHLFVQPCRSLIKGFRSWYQLFIFNFQWCGKCATRRQFLNWTMTNVFNFVTNCPFSFFSFKIIIFIIILFLKG